MRQYQFWRPFLLFFELLFCFQPVFIIALFLTFLLVFFAALVSHGREPFSKLIFKNYRRSFADMNSLEGADDPEDTQ